MNKGFTLIELLIVMVVVGVLVTVALPKYYASLERGRSVEGIANLRAASDAINAQYVINGNSYPSSITGSSTLQVGDVTKSAYFTTPTVSLSGSTVVVTTSREDGSYTLKAYNSNGDLNYIECTGDGQTCLNIGMDLSNGKYRMNFAG